MVVTKAHVAAVANQEDLQVRALMISFAGLLSMQ
jgi:hypothetical protein